ncbi:Uncharacterised protein [Chromobacterium violaceum]|uniref:Uncharacterized protein n=1 Tax=Chromobacterium violaceum TaxID=536 RepID=A0A447TLG4_CHRVL|nr:Uncharacterised protein [Chromobacterium violaceum]
MSAHLVVALGCAFQTRQWQEQSLLQTEGAGELKRASIVNELSGPLAGEGGWNTSCCIRRRRTAR